MNKNPYVPPAESNTDIVLHRTNDELRRIAILQKAICACIWIQGALIAFIVGIRQWDSTWYHENFSWPGFLAVVVVGLVGASAILVLASQLRGGWQCILFGMIAPFPFFGLLTMLGANAMASRELGQNGVKVGWLGADLSKLHNDDQQD